MKISIIAVGKLKEQFWKQALGEYLKRLQSYADVSVVEIADLDPARFGDEQTLQKEGEAILGSLPERAFVTLLAIEGKLVSSEDIATLMETKMVEGTSHMVFIIGGSLGVSSEVARRADARISLGRITLPHNLARVVLAEQIYRAFRIMRNEPYHK